MLLRRITEHVKAQNWTAVALDFAIVVIGVFIGIQVSNWNDTQKLNATARIYEARLIGDIRNEIGVIDNRIENYTDILTIAKGLTETIGAQSVEPSPVFLRDTLFATALWRFRRTQDTYDELITTGELGLIANANVRSELSRYYRDLDAVAGIWDTPSSFRRFVRKNMPADIQEKIRQECYFWGEGEFEKIHFAFNTDCALQIPNDKLRDSINALLDVPEDGSRPYYIALNELIADVNFKINTLTRKRDTAIDLLALMEAR